MTDDELRYVFSGIEHDVITAGAREKAESDVRARLDAFDQVAGAAFSDDEIFRKLVMVIFYSGFRAKTVTDKRNVILAHFPDIATVAAYGAPDISRITSDPSMIRNKRKIGACVENARALAELSRAHGSVQAYIEAFGASESFENLFLLKEELEAKLAFVGGVTVYHLMTDLGLPVLKPDRVICRLFARLGLLESERQLLKAVLLGRRLARLTDRSIRYVDRVLVAHGQVASPELGISTGICLNKPRCSECSVRPTCLYGRER